MAEGQDAESTYSDCGALDLSSNGSHKVKKKNNEKKNKKTDPVGLTVRYEMMKLCTGSA